MSFREGGAGTKRDLILTWFVVSGRREQGARVWGLGQYCGEDKTGTCSPTGVRWLSTTEVACAEKAREARPASIFAFPSAGGSWLPAPVLKGLGFRV